MRIRYISLSARFRGGEILPALFRFDAISIRYGELRIRCVIRTFRRANLISAGEKVNSEIAERIPPPLQRMNARWGGGSREWGGKYQGGTVLGPHHVRGRGPAALPSSEESRLLRITLQAFPTAGNN